GHQRGHGVERGRLVQRIGAEQVAAGGVVGEAGRGKVGPLVPESSFGFPRARARGGTIRQNDRVPPQQPLLFQEFARQCPPVAHVRACSTASRIFSATSRLVRSGSSIGSPPFPMIVTRFVATSNPAPGSSGSSVGPATSTTSAPRAYAAAARA